MNDVLACFNRGWIQRTGIAGHSLRWRPHSKTNSQFRRSRGRFLDENRIIGGPAINMRIFHRRLVLRAGVVALILIVLWSIAIGPEPPARITISPEELVRAVTNKS